MHTRPGNNTLRPIVWPRPKWHLPGSTGRNLHKRWWHNISAIKHKLTAHVGHQKQQHLQPDQRMPSQAAPTKTHANDAPLPFIMTLEHNPEELRDWKNSLKYIITQVKRHFSFWWASGLPQTVHQQRLFKWTERRLECTQAITDDESRPMAILQEEFLWFKTPYSVDIMST